MLHPRQPCLLQRSWHRGYTWALRLRKRPLRQQRWLLLRLASLRLLDLGHLLPDLANLQLLLLPLASLDLLLLSLSSLDLLLLSLGSRRSRRHALCPLGLCNLLLDGRKSLVLLAGTTGAQSAMLCSRRGSLPCLLLCCGIKSTTLGWQLCLGRLLCSRAGIPLLPLLLLSHSPGSISCSKSACTASALARGGPAAARWRWDSCLGRLLCLCMRHGSSQGCLGLLAPLVGEPGLQIAGTLGGGITLHSSCKPHRARKAHSQPVCTCTCCSVRSMRSARALLSSNVGLGLTAGTPRRSASSCETSALHKPYKITVLSCSHDSLA